MSASLAPTSASRVREAVCGSPEWREDPHRDAMGDAFRNPKSEAEREIHSLVVDKTEQELFKQLKRLADAGAMQAKPTKKAENDKRITSGKIAQLKQKIADIKRLDPKPSMRYQCRPSGKPVINDVKFPGTYNARRDSLENYWRGSGITMH